MADDPFAPVRQIQALARVADSAAAEIFQQLLAHPQDPDADLWRKVMRELDAAAAQLDSDAIRLMAQVNDDALAALTDATQRAAAFMQQTQDIKQGLKVFASVLALAGALTSGGGAAAVVKAAKGVKDAAAA